MATLSRKHRLTALKRSGRSSYGYSIAGFRLVSQDSTSSWRRDQVCALDMTSFEVRSMRVRVGFMTAGFMTG